MGKETTMDKIQKLSQAIRLGATFRPQCNGSYFNNGRSCAIGAAYEAITGLTDVEDGIVGRVLNTRFQLPENMLSRVVFRNDCGETREEISDWLEGQGL